jgi:hypothetical protein
MRMIIAMCAFALAIPAFAAAPAAAGDDSNSVHCDACSVRYYTPGRCVCCQQETRVDLHDDSAEAKSKNK